MVTLLFCSGLLMLATGGMFLVLPGQPAAPTLIAGLRRPAPTADDSPEGGPWVAGVALIGVGVFLMLLASTT